MKPRVVRIVSYLPVGGVEKRLLAVLKKLKHYFDVEVICIHSRGKLAPLFEREGIPVTVIPFKSRLHPASLYKLASHLKRRKVDIVHTHMYRPNISGTLAARLAGVPVVVSNVHNVDHWDTPRQVLMDRLFHPLRDAVIAVSHAVERDIVEKSRTPPDKVKVIYNGLDIADFQVEAGSIDRMREELGISKDTFVISMVARLVPAKGHETLFRAMVFVEKVMGNVQVLVIGGGSYREYLEKTKQELGLKGIGFLGERGDVAPLLRVSRLSVLPSEKEGFSNVILESMASGVPMVASRVGGAEEVLISFRNGFLVERGDASGLAELLLRLAHRPRERKASGINGRRSVERNFSIEKMVQATKRLYLQLLEEKR